MSAATVHVTPARGSAIAGVAARLRPSRRASVELPEVHSFEDFLRDHARVKIGNHYEPYTTGGREILVEIIGLLDLILGSAEGGKPLSDASLAICGGAQWGKTVLVLNLLAYLLGVRFLSTAYYLPDDDLVQNIVDGKFRPDVVEQIDWFARLTTTGKTVNKSGKQVNRKGALLVTDGTRTALGYVLGLNKPATSISADVVVVDERDDVKEKFAKYLRGRLTSSALRLLISIGTMRVHGAGQNRQFADGTGHVLMLDCPDPTCGHAQNPEDEFPTIVRMAVDGAPSPADPRLGYEGDFRDPLGRVFAHDLDAHYYRACVRCGTELDATRPHLRPQHPERAKQRRWSVRVAQLGMSAIDLVQIVADWCDNAVKDPEAMVAFCCDRLAKPKNTSQKLTPEIIERARRGPAFTLSLAGTPGTARYGGLDMGDRCWLTCREVHSPAEKRVIWLEQVALGRVSERVPALFQTLGMSCLFIDSRPDAATSRNLCWQLNGLVGFAFPKIADAPKAYIMFPGGLVWDGPAGRWRGLKAAVVEFALKEGDGIRHKLGLTDDGLMYPIVQCSRDQAIQRVVNDFLTAEEGVVEVREGKLRTEPVLRLPAKTAGSPAVLQTFEDHLLVGSQKEADPKGVEHFVDKVENHFLLSAAYSDLAEREEAGNRYVASPPESVPIHAPGNSSRLAPTAGALF